LLPVIIQRVRRVSVFLLCTVVPKSIRSTGNHPSHPNDRKKPFVDDDDDDDDEPEVYYAQLMYLVASEGGRALTQNREASPTVDRVNQPRADIVAQMGT
jgi:hypothetical protein